MRFGLGQWLSLLNLHLTMCCHNLYGFISNSLAGGGQECCYGNDEDILNVLFSDDGGFAHRNHHSGVSPYAYPGKVPYLSHFYTDVIPWEHCCYLEGGDNCDLYKRVRPSQTCENYQPPPPGIH